MYGDRSTSGIRKRTQGSGGMGHDAGVRGDPVIPTSHVAEVRVVDHVSVGLPPGRAFPKGVTSRILPSHVVANQRGCAVEAKDPSALNCKGQHIPLYHGAPNAFYSNTTSQGGWGCSPFVPDNRVVMHPSISLNYQYSATTVPSNWATLSGVVHDGVPGYFDFNGRRRGWRADQGHIDSASMISGPIPLNEVSSHQSAVMPTSIVNSTPISIHCLIQNYEIIQDFGHHPAPGADASPQVASCVIRYCV